MTPSCWCKLDLCLHPMRRTVTLSLLTIARAAYHGKSSNQRKQEQMLEGC